MINETIIEKLESLRNELVKNGLTDSEIDRRITELGTDLIEKMAIEFLPALKKNAINSIREHDLKNKEFLCRLEFRWYKAFDLLETLIGSSLETIQGIDDHEITNESTKWVIVKRLHARSIRIAKEIVILLRNGYADGALARWRSLFEICITSLILNKYDNELAEMYQAYKDVESYNELIEYQKRCDGLGFEKISEDDDIRIKTKMDNLEEKYGTRFLQQYGWTCRIFPTGKLSFNRIVEDIDYELWKPYYKMACNSVHSGPKAIYYNIGLSDRQDILLVGPTNIGFTDPAQLTSISILQISSILVNMAPNYERLVIISALRKLSNEIVQLFGMIQHQIDEEEKGKDA